MPVAGLGVAGAGRGERRGEGRGVVSREGGAAAAAASASALRKFLVSPTNSSKALSSSLETESEAGQGFLADGSGRGPARGARSEAVVAARVAAPRKDGSVGVATRRGGVKNGDGDSSGNAAPECERWAEALAESASAAKARSCAFLDVSPWG